MGHSGAGKSTILNLIPRFYDSDKGKILIDGQNIHEVSLSSLRKNISLVSQDTILFDDKDPNGDSSDGAVITFGDDLDVPAVIRKRQE